VPTPAPPAPVVPVATAAPATLSADLVVTAEFEPFQAVDVMAKVAGYVRSINVDIGDHVRQGKC
jgi:multidrug efflux pump subunit AcrA (membrane-fusion protein)